MNALTLLCALPGSVRLNDECLSRINNPHGSKIRIASRTTWDEVGQLVVSLIVVNMIYDKAPFRSLVDLPVHYDPAPVARMWAWTYRIVEYLSVLRQYSARSGEGMSMLTSNVLVALAWGGIVHTSSTCEVAGHRAELSGILGPLGYMAIFGYEFPATVKTQSGIHQNTIA